MTVSICSSSDQVKKRLAKSVSIPISRRFPFTSISMEAVLVLEVAQIRYGVSVSCVVGRTDVPNVARSVAHGGTIH